MFVPAGALPRAPRPVLTCQSTSPRLRRAAGSPPWLPGRETRNRCAGSDCVGQGDRREDFAANPPRCLEGDTDIAEHHLPRQIVQRDESDGGTFIQAGAAQVRRQH